MTQKSQTSPFEKNLTELREIVTQLEKGKLSFEDGLKAFEKGIQLFRKCNKTLEEGRKKIEVLTSIEEDPSGNPSVRTKPL